MRRELCDSGLNLRKKNGKRASLAGGTFNLDASPMGLGDGAGDTQPQTDALCVSGARLGSSVKAAEDQLLFILGKANARIGDPQGCPIFFRLKRYSDAPTFWGVFDCVVHQV